MADVRMWTFVVGFRNLLAGVGTIGRSSSCAAVINPSARPSS
jgi:hypothetical protein